MSSASSIAENSGSTLTLTATISQVADEDVTVNLDANGEAIISIFDIDGGIYDNCSSMTVTLDIDTFTCSDIGENIVNVTASDASGNESSATVAVIVTNEWEDIDNDNIYMCTVSNLIFGKNYSYTYSINDSIEDLDSARFFTVNNEDNVIEDFYNELNPTLIKFFVNMSYQVSQGNFNPAINYVDVAGSFNGWVDEWNIELQLKEDNIFSAIMTDVQEGDVMEFKFRINGDWETSEFSFGVDRIYEVVQGENILEFWYNDEDGI